jgi:hypothetical protein
VTGVLATFGLLAMAWLPQEHVHLIRTHDGHHPDVVHRHYESHQRSETKAALDHGDEGIEWLAASFTKPKPSPVGYPILQLLNDPPVAPLEAVRVRAFRIVRVSVHDPPWLAASGLRAPPVLPLT